MIKHNTGEDLLRYHYKKHKFVVFDDETENLCLVTNNKPWEVGYITVENGEIKSQFNHRLWWDDLNISKDAARITHFNYEDYKRTAKDPRKILDEFEPILYDKNTVNITYNGLNFDMYIHQLWRKKLGLEPNYKFLKRSIDVLALCRAYKLELEPPTSWEEFFCWQFKLINYYSDGRTRKQKKKELGGSTTLGAMAKEFGVNIDENKTHSGLYDVILTWEVFKQLIWKMELTTEHLGLQ